MAFIRSKSLGYLGLLLIILAFAVIRSRGTNDESNVTEVGADWEWELSSHMLNDAHRARTESRGVGMREGLKNYWKAMLSDNTGEREYQLRWNQEIFSFWSWDHEQLPELSELRKARVSNPQKYEAAINFLVNGQLHALLKVDEEDFDLEAETVNLIAVLHLEVS